MERVYKTLQRQYRRAKITYGKGLTEKGETRKVSEVFVRLMVLERGDLKSAFQKQSFGTAAEASRRLEHVFNDLTRGSDAKRSVELSELFPLSASASAEDDSFRVLLLASAGCGKTTLMTKYCPLMWANGELWADQFDLVICGELRNEEIRRANGVGDLLGGWSSVGIENIDDRQRIVDFVEDHPHRVCLILDGLDETKLESCSSFVQAVLRGEKLCGIRLVLTSRPCDDVFSLCEAHPFSQRVELVGFLPGDVKEYVKRCVLNEEKATELLHVIEEDISLASVMSTPYFASRVCELFTWSGSIPRCVSRIFELMILQIAERRCMKSYKTWTDVPCHVQRDILDLGEFAFRMLVSQQLCFSESQLKEHSLSVEGISLGMLVTCEPGTAAGRERQYRFSHLVLQESLSALFVALSSRLYPAKLVRLVEALGPRSGHLSMFWQLLASYLDKECMNCFCNALLTREHKPLPAPELEALLFDRNVIPLGVQDTLCGLLSLSSMERAAVELLKGLVKGDAVTAVENEMQCSRRSNNTDFFKTLLAMWLRLSPTSHIGTLLASVRLVDSSAVQSCCEIAGIAESLLGDVCLSMSDSLVLSISDVYRPKFELVCRCFMEYTHHCSSPLNSVLPVHAISSFLAKRGISLSLDSDPAATYALEHVVQHHREAITSCTMYTKSTRHGTSVHLGLSRRVLQCPNLIKVKLLPGIETPVNLIIPCVVRNESVKAVDFGVQKSDGLAAVAEVMKVWPSLESVSIAVDSYDGTLMEEDGTSAFLDSVRVLLKLRHINICINKYGKKFAPLSRLLDRHSYPSRVRLGSYPIGDFSEVVAATSY